MCLAPPEADLQHVPGTSRGTSRGSTLKASTTEEEARATHQTLSKRQDDVDLQLKAVFDEVVELVE